MIRKYCRKPPEEQYIDNVKELCRLCLSHSDEMLPIFSEDSDNVCTALSIRITICVGLEMARDNHLPNAICTTCCRELDRYYTFRKKCEASYHKLKSHLEAAKSRDVVTAVRSLTATVSNRSLVDTKPSVVLSSEDNGFGFIQEMVVHNGGLDDVPVIEIPTSEVDKPVQTVNSSEIMDQRVLQIVEHNDKDQIVYEMKGAVSPQQGLSLWLSAALSRLGVLQWSQGAVSPASTVSTVSTVSQQQTRREQAGDGCPVRLLLQARDGDVPFELLELDDDQDEDNAETTDVLSESPTDSGHNQQTWDAQSASASQCASPRQCEWGPQSQSHRCAQCGRRLSSGAALALHSRVHSGARPYACPHCARRFAQRAVRDRHLHTHTEPRPFPCALCPKSYTQRAALSSHQRSHCAPGHRALALHRCARCPKVFLHPSGLSRHMMMHRGRMYQCGACGRRFMDRSSLLRHLHHKHHQHHQHHNPDNRDALLSDDQRT